MAVKVDDIEFDRRQMIGWGPNGTVVLRGTFKAGQAVAVKRLITKQLKQDADQFQLYRKLDHDNILRLHHVASDQAGFTYLALEMCVCNLADYLNGKYRGPTILSRHNVILQISQGLQHLHSLPTIHRGLKPTNILINQSDSGQIQIKLADFGLNSTSNDSWPCSNRDSIEGWLAPEQIKSSGLSTTTTLTTAADIFALGCLFFSVLTSGQHPFGSPSYFRDQRALAGHYDLAPVDQQLPVAASLIERMIQRVPEYRPSVDDILAQSNFWALDI